MVALDSIDKKDVSVYVPKSVKEIQQKINDSLEQKTHGNNDEKRVYIFFSFDIVNSTAYKGVTTNWPSIISELMNRLRSMVYKELETSSLWRFIGDELVFVVEVYDMESIYVIIDSIFKITQNINVIIRDGSFFECLQDQRIKYTEVATLKKQGLLAIKAAAWLAIISEKEYSSYECIRTIYEGGPHSLTIEEFQGQDIDTGFRLKAYTQSRRLILSFELAYLLSKRAPSSLYIMDYVPLKGVWNGALYPLIWYYNQTIVRESLKKDISFEESFYYDEANGNKLLKAYFSRRNNSLKMTDIGIDIKMFNDPESSLEKVCFDRNLNGKIDAIKDLLQRQYVHIQTNLSKNNPLEIHCAVVCCNVKDKSVMIIHRGESKDVYKGAWEFGCAKLNSHEHMVDTIEEYYLKMYDVKIRMVIDRNRCDQKMPLPIAVFELEKDGNIKKGIIFVAEILNGPQKEFRENDMHDSIQFITKDQIKECSECAVPDFKATLDTVFARFEEFFNGG